MPYTELLAILCISLVLRSARDRPAGGAHAGRQRARVWGYLGFGAGLFDLLPARIYGVTANYTLIAIPLFVFMGVMLEKSKIADDLMDVIGHLAGGLRGGMGIGIILVGVLMGATTGIVGATIVTLGLITLPALIRRGYHLPTACGTICASGTLGQIIPPSTILILLADILGQSVGTLFAAALFPGPGALRHLLHLPAAARHRSAQHGAAGGPGGAAGDVGRPALPFRAPHRAAADQPRSGGAGLHHRRRRSADRSGLHGCAGLDRGGGAGGAVQFLGAARDGAGDDPHHRRHDVHPDLRAGVRARLPRTARREAGRGPLQRRARRRERRADLHDGC